MTSSDLQNFLENALDAMHWIAPDGTILWANAAELGLLGYTADEYIGRNIATFHDDRAAIEDILARLLRTEAIRDYPARLRHKDGTTREVLITSSVFKRDDEFAHTHCITRDVTEQRRELDEVRDRLAAIVDSSDDAIVSKTLDGVITSWNRGAENIFGFTAAEAVGRHITLIIPEDLRGEEDNVLARLRRGERIDHYETVRRTKDGRLLDISLTVSPVRNADGRIVGASKVARDISAWKRAEELLRESEQQAIAAVQTRDDFLSVAAHELRNPINALQLQLVGLYRVAQQADDSMSREWVADRLGQTTEDVATLVRLVHNLLDVARISAGRIDVEPEDLDFGDVIRAVVRRFGHELAGGRVALEVPAVKGRSDRLRLEQVVTNLVSNAIKFGADKPIEIALRADDERAYFSVTDHGIGIDPARQSELFARFSRAVPRREYGGFGLGLWIARETVRAIGGEIWLTSTPGEGSTFSVSLPRVLAAGVRSCAIN